MARELLEMQRRELQAVTGHKGVKSRPWTGRLLAAMTVPLLAAAAVVTRPVSQRVSRFMGVLAGLFFVELFRRQRKGHVSPTSQRQVRSSNVAGAQGGTADSDTDASELAAVRAGKARNAWAAAERASQRTERFLERELRR